MSDTMDLGVALALGFFGSAHCVGMCGGFAMLSGVGPGSRSKRTVRVAAYLSGKTVTYAILGGILAGLVSSMPPSVSMVQKGIAIATGIFLIFSGLHMTGYGPSWLLLTPKSSSMLVSRMSAAVKTSSTSGRFLLGLINGLLPCGLLYGALGYSAVMQSWLEGAAFMTVFGLGTAPALAAVALGTTLLSESKRAGIYHAVGWAVVVMGVLTVVRASPLMPMIMGSG